MRRHRERKAITGTLPPAVEADPIGALADWARERLIVPPGHPLAGQPLALPAFAESFLRGAWGVHEAVLSTARKNAKSAITAALLLGHLVGPLHRRGWRGAVGYPLSHSLMPSSVAVWIVSVRPSSSTRVTGFPSLASSNAYRPKPDASGSRRRDFWRINPCRLAFRRNRFSSTFRVVFIMFKSIPEGEPGVNPEGELAPHVQRRPIGRQTATARRLEDARSQLTTFNDSLTT